MTFFARLRSRRLAVPTLLAVVVALLFTWLIAFSPVLGVRTVAVSGAHELTVDQVRAAAAIASGTPLLRLDTAAVEQRVERLPQVATAQVTTSLPSTVRISVTERVPVGVVQIGSVFRVVDSNGTEYESTSKRPSTLPLFAFDSSTPAAATVQAAAAVARALLVPLRARVASLSVSDSADVSLVLTDQRLVRWGNTTSNAAKAARLSRLIDQQWTQIDLSSPTQVVTHN